MYNLVKLYNIKLNIKTGRTKSKLLKMIYYLNKNNNQLSMMSNQNLSKSIKKRQFISTELKIMWSKCRIINAKIIHAKGMLTTVSCRESNQKFHATLIIKTIPSYHSQISTVIWGMIRPINHQHSFEIKRNKFSSRISWSSSMQIRTL